MDRLEWLEGIKKSWGIAPKKVEEVKPEDTDGLKTSRKDKFLEKIGAKFLASL